MMTKDDLEQAEFWLAWVAEQDTAQKRSTEMGCVFSTMSRLINEVRRLQGQSEHEIRQARTRGHHKKAGG